MSLKQSTLLSSIMFNERKKMNQYIELMDDLASDINVLKQKERKRREHEVNFSSAILLFLY